MNRITHWGVNPNKLGISRLSFFQRRQRQGNLRSYSSQHPPVMLFETRTVRVQQRFKTKCPSPPMRMKITFGCIFSNDVEND